MSMKFLDLSKTKTYHVQIAAYMFQHATERFQLMAKWNHDDPLDYRYANYQQYFVPLKTTGKMLFGIVTYDSQSCAKLHNDLVKSPAHRSWVQMYLTSQRHGALFGEIPYWAGWIPHSAFQSIQNYTSKIPDMPVGADPFTFGKRPSMGVSAYGEYHASLADRYELAFHIHANKTQSNWKFSISLHTEDESIQQSLLEFLSSNKFRVHYKNHFYVFESIADYPDVLDVIAEWNRTHPVIYVVDLSDVPKHFSLDNYMRYTPPVLHPIEYDFDYKTVPYAYQEEAIEYGLQRDCFLLADQQGLGKTMESANIAVIHKAQRGYKHCLVICCVNTLKWNWIQEIQTHTAEQAHVLGSHRKKNGTYVYSTAARMADLDNIDSLPYFLITNIEFLRNTSAVKKLKDLISKGEINMIIVDEFHKCKNHNTQQTKGLLSLQPECRIAMTGTPVVNHPVDFFTCLKWLGYEQFGHAIFKKYYTDRAGELRHMDVLEHNLSLMMLRRTKDEVLDLPEKQYIDQYVDLPQEHVGLYARILVDEQEALREDEAPDNILTRILRLRQCTEDPVLIDPSIDVPSNKFQHAFELIQTALAGGESVLVYSEWVHTLRHFKQFLRGNRIITGPMITGETKDIERTKIKDDFQNSETPQVLLGTPKAMGVGLTFTKATVVIFLDEPWTDADKEQAVDRCHRIGTTNHITIYTIMCKDTIDERVHQLLLYKKNLSNALVDKKAEARFLLGLADMIPNSARPADTVAQACA